MKLISNLSFAPLIFATLSLAQEQANLQWTYTTKLPATTFAWDARSFTTAETGESLWVVSERTRFEDEPVPDRYVIVWLDRIGQPIKELALSYPATRMISEGSESIYRSSVVAIWADAKKAALHIERSFLKTNNVLEMTISGSEVSLREYPVMGFPLSYSFDTRISSDGAGFFTKAIDETSFTLRRYRFGTTIVPLVLLFRVDTDDLSLAWDSDRSLRYFLETSDDLRGWTAVSGPLAGSGAQLRYSSKLNAPVRFFRVRADR